MTDKEIIAALQLVASKYGKKLAATVEQIFRNETEHFKSREFQVSLSPGMEALALTSPYGWGSFAPFWKANPLYAPVGVHKQVENDSLMSKSRGERTFVQFPSIEASVMSVAFVINLRGGVGGAWFTVTDLKAQKVYTDALNKIIPRFVNANIK